MRAHEESFECFSELDNPEFQAELAAYRQAQEVIADHGDEAEYWEEFELDFGDYEPSDDPTELWQDEPLDCGE